MRVEPRCLVLDPSRPEAAGPLPTPIADVPRPAATAQKPPVRNRAVGLRGGMSAIGVGSGLTALRCAWSVNRQSCEETRGAADA